LLGLSLLNDLDCFLDRFHFLLVWNEENEGERQQRAASLTNVENPEVVQVFVVNADEVIKGVSQHFG